jgi:hypothetical protein
MFRTALVIVISIMVVLSGMLPGTSRADDRKGKAAVWPSTGAVDYRVSYGTGGLVLGRGHYSWTHDGTTYKMQLALETTGVVGLLHKLDYVQSSQGDIGPNGLRPSRFDVTHKGKPPDAALFDWNGTSGARVSIRRDERERHNFGLTPGDQDMLSIWRQIGHMAQLPDSMLVVGNKNARHARIVNHEDVDLKVSAGSFATRRFSARSDDGKLKIDFWLAKAHHMVPVRVILGDDKSETLVFEATALRVPSGN